VGGGLIATLGLDAEAGVDDSTRAWLSNLPDHLRPQLAAIVEDTLSSVDFHFDRDVKKLREQLTKAETDFVCNWIGLNSATVTVLKNEIPFLSQPAPVHELRTYIEEQRREALKQHLQSTFMQDLYADLERKAGIVRCEKLPPDAVATVDSMGKKLSERWMLWTRMDAAQCGDDNGCFTKYQTIVASYALGAQKLQLDALEQQIVAGALTDIRSVQPPLGDCSIYQRWVLFKKICYDADKYEDALQKLADVDDRLGLMLTRRALKERIAAAVITTADNASGTLARGGSIRSPKNTYFAIMQDDCQFVIYRGVYNPVPKPANVVASTKTSPPPTFKAYSNCRLDLQRDGELVLYGDVQIVGPPMIVVTVAKPTPPQINVPLWQSKTGDAHNADYWIALLDSGKLELHAGTPYADGGARFTSELLFNDDLHFIKSP
jgi:hypothetical protein